jgi:hypothetical protein
VLPLDLSFHCYLDTLHLQYSGILWTFTWSCYGCLQCMNICCNILCTSLYNCLICTCCLLLSAKIFLYHKYTFTQPGFPVSWKLLTDITT